MGNKYQEIDDPTLPEPPLEGMTPVAKKQTKPRARGRGNAPQTRPAITDENREIIRQFLKESLVAYKMPKVQSDQELAERIGEYFDLCADRGQFPTVEEMSLFTGYTPQHLNCIQRGDYPGFSPETKNIIANSKAYLASFDAKMAATGKMNFLTYCFRAKNFYDMVDKQEHVLTPNQPLGAATTPEEIASKYKELPEGE